MFLIRKSALLLLLAALSCTNRKEKLQQVMALQQMNDLATVEYVVTKIIKANDNATWYKIGDRKILLSCRATLTAGIDLSQVKEQNIQISGDNIELTLPPAKLISLNINPEDISQEFEEVAVFRQHFKPSEINNLAAQAEEEIRNSIDSMGLLQTAQTNASLFITNFLRRLGYKTITIHTGPNPSLNIKTDA
jgi:hypothetical protein